MLGRMAAGFGILGLASLLKPASLLAGATTSAPQFAPKAKRLVFLFLNGGPSHLDTFDPKPALLKHAGQQPSGELYKTSKGAGFMPSPFAFAPAGRSGIEVSETLPHLARVIDDCCVIRSMHTDVPNHEPALLQMHTGNLQPIRPSLGSWLLYGLVIRHVRMHRADDAAIVDHAREMWQRFADLDAAATGGREGKWRRHEAGPL